jgi:hypothetical protein
MLHTWVSLIIVAQYVLVWKRKSNTCVMCICFMVFSSIVSGSGNDSVLLGPSRNVLCQIWELNEIHWLWCDDDKSLGGKWIKYILYWLIINHEQTKRVLRWSITKFCFIFYTLQWIEHPILILKLFTLWILNQYFHLMYQLNALIISDIKATLHWHVTACRTKTCQSKMTLVSCKCI